MKIRFHIIIFLFLTIMISSFSLSTGQNFTKNSDSCTIFSVSIGNTTYFGNNEDFLLNGTYIWLVPRQDYNITGEILNLPGLILLGFDHNNHPVDGKMQGGMNEYGLSWDANGLPPVSMYENTSGKELWYFNYSIWVWMQTLLECRNISDVIQWFQTYDLGDAMGGQAHYCDANGNAVVVSVNSTGNFTFTTMGANDFLVSTNFNVAWPENHYDPYPCPRYQTATYMLKDITTEKELTPKACQDILEAVATSQTSYSNVFDPIHQEMYLNIYQDFSKTANLNLHDELEKVTPDGKDTLHSHSYYYKEILMADLFKSIPSYVPLIVVFSILIAMCSIAVISLRTRKIFLK